MPLIRLHDARHVIAPARFDQQYIDIRILGESACYTEPEEPEPRTMKS
jgi:hypothetical protein